MRRVAGLATVASLSAAPAYAQPPGTVPVPAGAELRVVIAGDVSSRTAVVGDAVPCTVDEALVVRGHVVVAKGAPARASVSEVERAGLAGRGGRLVVRVESVAATDGTHIPVNAAERRSGGDRTGTAVLLAVVLGPLGLLKGGREANLRAGTPIAVYIDSSVAVRAP